MSITEVANGGFYLLGDANAVVQIVNMPFRTPVPSAFKRIKVDTADKRAMTEKKIIPWGSNNMLPKEIKTDINSNSLLKRALKVRIDAHYGKGIQLMKKEYPEGKLNFTPVGDTEIDEFFRVSQISKFQYGIISDFEFFRNIFPVVVTNAGRTKILRIYRAPAMFCRWGEQDSSGKIKKMYRYDWYNGGSIKPKDLIPVDVLDIDNPIEDLRSRKSGTEFVLPIKTEEFDNFYYDETFWDPIRKTWLPVACSIPELKMAIMKNQMVIKYHAKIPYNWIKQQCEEQKLTTPEQQKEFIDKLVGDINKYLTDVKNYGKTFVSFYGVDPMNPTKELGEWKIEVLDNKLKHEDHLPDAKAANQEIMASLGLDYTLLGGTLPGGTEAGSGSNKREAFFILQLLLSPDRDFTTSWFDFVRDYNKWNPDYTIKNIFIETQTLDKNPTGSKNVI